MFLFQKESFFYFYLFQRERNQIECLYEEEGITKTVDCRFPGRITCGSIYLFFPLTKYEPSLVKESSGDKKYYCIDYGLRSVLLNPQSEDNGKLLENAVYLHLRRNLPVQVSLHYYKGKNAGEYTIHVLPAWKWMLKTLSLSPKQ